MPCQPQLSVLQNGDNTASLTGFNFSLSHLIFINPIYIPSTALGPRDTRVNEADPFPALTELTSQWEGQTLNKHTDQQNISGCDETLKNADEELSCRANGLRAYFRKDDQDGFSEKVSSQLRPK